MRPLSIKGHQSSRVWITHIIDEGSLARGGDSTNTEYEARPEELGHERRRPRELKAGAQEQTGCVWGTVSSLEEARE